MNSAIARGALAARARHPSDRGASGDAPRPGQPLSARSERHREGDPAPGPGGVSAPP
ncbi:hypothetical protein SLNWT_2725 [Streptomyces albus]|uniref:Uncharacterized protein n=1 Tax=Streptomyces albus (strain ATCC 21838 / DSM 41398 / FERM P-419 / JCM 4703 / NBRC 107858) TaxID=1081613 RepID=A0A0B5EWP9_STRA4|nr:hypothetical protein SLNWT_2725 [Streptomyces albus]AOU77412.1 hypothetical protein SLNHY_2721 [Streptomyces albus]